jgi:hypothetical protein
LCFRIIRSEWHEHTDAPHALALLRTRRERPRGRRTAEKRLPERRSDSAPTYLSAIERSKAEYFHRQHRADRQRTQSLLITTEAMVAERPKKETPMPAMPPGGGMDY